MQLLYPARTVGAVEVVRAVNSAICKYRKGAKWTKCGDAALKLATPFHWRHEAWAGNPTENFRANK